MPRARPEASHPDGNGMLEMGDPANVVTTPSVSTRKAPAETWIWGTSHAAVPAGGGCAGLPSHSS